MYPDFRRIDRGPSAGEETAIRLAVFVGVMLVMTIVNSAAARPSSFGVTVVSSLGASCAARTEFEGQAIARRWHEEAVNAGGLAVIDQIVTEDVIHHAGPFLDGAWPEAITHVLRALMTWFPDTEHTIEQVIASDEFVVIRFQAEGTHEGEFQGLAAAGKLMSWIGINIFRFECGLIAEEWSEVDGLSRIRQLDAEATPTP